MTKVSQLRLDLSHTDWDTLNRKASQLRLDLSHTDWDTYNAVQSYSAVCDHTFYTMVVCPRAPNTPPQCLGTEQAGGASPETTRIMHESPPHT